MGGSVSDARASRRSGSDTLAVGQLGGDDTSVSGGSVEEVEAEVSGDIDVTQHGAEAVVMFAVGVGVGGSSASESENDSRLHCDVLLLNCDRTNVYRVLTVKANASCKRGNESD